LAADEQASKRGRAVHHPKDLLQLLTLVEKKKKQNQPAQLQADLHTWLDRRAQRHSIWLDRWTKRRNRQWSHQHIKGGDRKFGSTKRAQTMNRCIK
jgi:hypothetical protein